MNNFKRDVLKGVRHTIAAVQSEEIQDLHDLPDAIEKSDAADTFHLAIMDLQMADFFLKRAASRRH